MNISHWDDLIVIWAGINPILQQVTPVEMHVHVELMPVTSKIDKRVGWQK